MTMLADVIDEPDVIVPEILHSSEAFRDVPLDSDRSPKLEDLFTRWLRGGFTEEGRKILRVKLFGQDGSKFKFDILTNVTVRNGDDYILLPDLTQPVFRELREHHDFELPNGLIPSIAIYSGRVVLTEGETYRARLLRTAESGTLFLPESV